MPIYSPGNEPDRIKDRIASLKTSFAKVRVYASLSHLSRGETSKDGTQQVPPFELSPLRVNVARGQQGLERYFSLASSTLLRSNIS